MSASTEREVGLGLSQATLSCQNDSSWDVVRGILGREVVPFLTLHVGRQWSSPSRAACRVVRLLL